MVDLGVGSVSLKVELDLSTAEASIKQLFARLEKQSLKGLSSQFDAVGKLATAMGKSQVLALQDATKAADTVAAAWTRTNVTFKGVAEDMRGLANKTGEDIVQALKITGEELFDKGGISRSINNIKSQVSDIGQGIGSKLKIDLQADEQLSPLKRLKATLADLGTQVKSTNFNKYDALAGGFPKIAPSLAAGGAVFGGALIAGTAAIASFKDEAIQAFQDVSRAIIGFTAKALGEAVKITGSLNKIISITGESDTKELQKAIIAAGVASSQETGAIAKYAETLAKSGLNQKEIGLALKPIAIASDASGEDIAKVGKATIAAANAYGFAAKDLGKVSGSLIAASTSAQGSSIAGYAKFSQYFKVTSQRQDEAIKTSASIYSLLKSAGSEDASAGRNIASFMKALSNPSKKNAIAQDEINAIVKAQGSTAKVGGFNDDGSRRSELTTILETVKAYKILKQAKGDQVAAQLIGASMGTEAFRQIQALSLQTDAQIQKTLDNVTRKIENTNIVDQFYKQATSGFAGATKLLDGAIDGFTASYGLAVASIADTGLGVVASAFSNLATNSGELFAPLDKLGADFKAFAANEPAFNALSSALTALGEDLVKMAIGSAVDIMRDLGTAFSDVSQIVTTLGVGLKLAINGFFLMAGGLKNLVVLGKEVSVFFTDLFSGKLVASTDGGNPIMRDMASDFRSGFEDIGKAMAVLGAAFKDIFALLLPPVLAGAAAAFKLLGVAIRFVAPILSSVASIIAMIASVTLYKLAGAFKIAVSFVEPLIRAMAGGFEVINQVIGVFTRLFTSAITEASRLLIDISRALDAVIGRPMRGAVDGINNAVSGLIANISQYVPLVGKIIGGIVTVIRKPTGAFSDLGRALGNAKGLFGGTLAAITTNASTQAVNLGTTLAKILNPFLGMYVSAVKGVGQSIVQMYNGGISAIFKLLSNSRIVPFLEKLTGVSARVLDDILQVVLVVGDNIIAYWDNLTGAIGSKATLPDFKALVPDFSKMQMPGMPSMPDFSKMQMPGMPSMPDFSKEANDIYNSFAGPLQAIAQFLQPITDGVGALVQSLANSAIADVLKFAAYYMEQVQVNLKLLGDTLAPIAKLLQDTFGAAFASVMQTIQPVMSELKIALDQTFVLLGNIYNIIKPLLPAIAAVIAALVLAPLAPILGGVALAVAAIVGNWELFKVAFVVSLPFIRAAWVAFVLNFEVAFRTVVFAITTVWEVFKLGIVIAFTAIKIAWTVMTTALILPWQTLVAIITGDWTQVQLTLSNSFTEIGRLLTNLLTYIQTFFTNIGTAISTFMQGVITATLNAVNQMAAQFGISFNGIVQAIQGAISGLISGLQGAIDGISNGAGGALKGLISIASGVGDTIRGWLRPIEDAVSALGRAGNAMRDYSQAAASSVGNVGNTVTQAITSAPEWLGGMFKFARGGVLPGYSATDDQLIMARSGEGILVPEAVRALGGERGIERLNRNSERGLPAFATGGVVGRLSATGTTQFKGILGAIAAITKSFPALQEVIGDLQKSVTTKGLNALGTAIGKLSTQAKQAISTVVNTSVNKLQGGSGGTIRNVATALGSSVTDSLKPVIIAQAALAAGLTKSQTAYVLATAQHESDQFRTMREYASGADYEGRSDLGNTLAGDGKKFKGRGFVQLTGRANYAKYAKKLGIDLLNRPELAEVPEIAAKILIDGMKTGAFTGRALADYQGDDFSGMRAIINGSDKAGLIAGYADKYAKALAGITAVGVGISGDVLNTLSDVARVSSGQAKSIGSAPKSLKAVLAKVPQQYRAAIEAVLNGNSKTLPAQLAQWLNQAIPGVLKPGAIGADASKIVATARSWVGREFNPGVFAQCANFVRNVFAQSGLKLSEVLSRSADGSDYGVQEAGSLLKASIGTIIKDKSKVIAGDIITWKKSYGNYGDDVTHVGIATGNGMMIDRSTAGAPVRERSIDTFRDFVAAIRPGGTQDLAVNGKILKDGLLAIVGKVKPLATVINPTFDKSLKPMPNTMDVDAFTKAMAGIGKMTTSTSDMAEELAAFKQKQTIDPIYGAALKAKLKSLGVSEEEATTESAAGAVKAVVKVLKPTMASLLEIMADGVKNAFQRAETFAQNGNQIQRQLQRGDLSNTQRLRALPLVYQQMLGSQLSGLGDAPSINNIIDRLVQQPKSTAPSDINIRLDTRSIGGEQYVPLSQVQQSLRTVAKAATNGTNVRYSYSERLANGIG